MGKGDHSNGIFSTTDNTPAYTEGDMQLTISNGNAVRSRHLSQSGAPVPGVPSISIFGSLPVLSRLKGSGLYGNGYSIAGVPPKNVEQEKSLLGKDGELCQEKERGCCRGNARRNMILGILLLANLINYMDRYTIAGMRSIVEIYRSNADL